MARDEGENMKEKTEEEKSVLVGKENVGKKARERIAAIISRRKNCTQVEGIPYFFPVGPSGLGELLCCNFFTIFDFVPLFRHRVQFRRTAISALIIIDL